MIQDTVHSQHHLDARLSWARRNISQGDLYWWRTIFSDEKKFNLDGPDGNKFHWCELNNDKYCFLTRVGETASVVVWGANYFYEAEKSVFYKANKNSVNIV